MKRIRKQKPVFFIFLATKETPSKLIGFHPIETQKATIKIMGMNVPEMGTGLPE